MRCWQDFMALRSAFAELERVETQAIVSVVDAPHICSGLNRKRNSSFGQTKETSDTSTTQTAQVTLCH